MPQQEKPDDYVFATGGTNELEGVMTETFRYFELDWRKHTISNPVLLRTPGAMVSRGNSDIAATTLGWRAIYSVQETV